MITAQLADHLTVLPPSKRPNPVHSASRVMHHHAVARHHMRLVLHNPEVARRTLPGQFVMISIPESVEYHALPRPMAIHRVHKGSFEVIYRIKGEGTAALARVAENDRVGVVGPLGRPFDVPRDTRRAVLLARGIGVCSLAMLVADLRQRDVDVTAVISARDRDVLVGAEDLREMGAQEVLTVLDSDDSSDVRTLEAALRSRGRADFLAVCGSQRLTDLAALLACDWSAVAQVSVEAHMACGMGYCHGCASAPHTRASESPLVCVDGPVFGLDYGVDR